MTNSTTRAFISIDFPQEVIKEIARLNPLINSQQFIGKQTELENIHLTLKFLGEISQEQIKQTKQQLSKIKFPKFQAKLLHIGTFSKHENPKIIWIKIGSKQLHELQSKIDESLFQLFPKEKRFMSHLTIARIKHAKDSKSFINYINNISIKPLKFPITNFKLKSSTLNPVGPIYTTLEEYNLT